MSARTLDTNGWYEVRRNPLSRIGVFQYSGGQLGLTGDAAGQMFKVLRPAEELGSAETVNSFRLLPWVDEHTMLGPNAKALNIPSMAAEEKGIHGVIGEDVVFEDGVLYGNIKVFSDTLATLIDQGKAELSAGYRCTYEMTPGTHPVFGDYDAVQRNIRGNHLASVDMGRMGPAVAVLDHMVFSFDAKEATMADPKDKEGADAAKGGEGEMTLSDAVALLKSLAPQIAELQKQFAALSAPAAKEPDGDEVTLDEKSQQALDAAKTGMDGITAALGKVVVAMDGLTKAPAAPTVKEIMGQIKDRDALADLLAPHVGTFDHAEMDVAAVAAYGCEKLGLKPAAGQERAALDGYLAAAAKAPGATVTHSTGMDGAPSGFVADYLNGKKD